MRVPPSAADPRPPRRATGPHPPAAAGKGFGTPAPGRSDKKKAARRDSAPPVDAATAARGRVDVVAVESWAAGADVGELKVKRFSPDVKEEGNGAAATPSPLYETLARRLATLQASGALTRPRAPGQPQRAALPPFEAWAWEAGRYASFLAATAALHAALDAALATAVGGGGSTAGAPAALARLGPASALARGAAAAAPGAGARRISFISLQPAAVDEGEDEEEEEAEVEADAISGDDGSPGGGGAALPVPATQRGRPLAAPRPPARAGRGGDLAASESEEGEEEGEEPDADGAGAPVPTAEQVPAASGDSQPMSEPARKVRRRV